MHLCIAESKEGLRKINRELRKGARRKIKAKECQALTGCLPCGYMVSAETLVRSLMDSGLPQHFALLERRGRGVNRDGAPDPELGTWLQPPSLEKKQLSASNKGGCKMNSRKSHC